jgi:hypothetical protein
LVGSTDNGIGNDHIHNGQPLLFAVFLGLETLDGKFIVASNLVLWNDVGPLVVLTLEAIPIVLLNDAVNNIFVNINGQARGSDRVLVGPDIVDLDVDNVCHHASDLDHVFVVYAHFNVGRILEDHVRSFITVGQEIGGRCGGGIESG